MLKLSSKSYVTVNGAAMAPQAARARGAICPLKSTRKESMKPRHLSIMRLRASALACGWRALS